MMSTNEKTACGRRELGWKKGQSCYQLRSRGERDVASGERECIVALEDVREEIGREWFVEDCLTQC